MRMPWNRAPQTAERAERASAVDVSIARTEAHLARVSETIAAEMQRELTEESGWQLLSDLGGDSYDLSNAARAAIAAKCIRLWMVDGAIGQAESLLASGTFGQGISAPRAADPRVQRIIDRFWDDADNQLALTSIDAMIGINRALMLEGERFLTVHTSAADSLVKLADIPASEITDVITHPQNRRKALVYKRSWRPARYDWGRGTWVTDTQPMVRYYRDLAAPDPRAPRDDDDDEALELLASVPDLDDDTAILHVRVNNIGLRGVPEVYRAYDWARTHAGTVSDMATMTKALSMFAWRKKIRTRSEAAVRSGASQFQSPPPGPGAVHVSNDNVELDPVNVGTGATSNQSATGRQTFLEAIRPFGFGEHWYGDASTGNLATASSMEQPAVWRILARQTLFERALRTVIDYAIERAIEMQDYLPIPRSVRRYYDLDFPPPQPRTEQTVSIMLPALANAASTGLIDKREASYQAYVLLGSDDIDEIMERQYPPQEQLEGEHQEAPEPEAPEELATEAERPDDPARDRLAGSFAARFQTEIISPWRESVRRWLRSVESVPGPAALRRALVANAMPDRKRIETLLVELGIEAGNHAGQQTVDRIREQLLAAAGVREAEGDDDDAAAAEKRAASPRPARRLRAYTPPETLAEQLQRGEGWGAPSGEFVFNLRNQTVLSTIAGRGQKITGEIAGTMLDDMHTVLTNEGYRQGLSGVGVAEQLDSIFPETYAARAITIARTEITASMGEVALQALSRNGIDRHQWLAMMRDTRHSHAALNGKIVRVGEDFKPGLNRPGDDRAGASEVVNCECDILPVLDEETALREVPWLGE